MPRTPKEPKYFPSRGGWYIQLQKQQILLARGPKGDKEVEAEAWRQFHAHMTTNNALADGDRAVIGGLCERYLRWVRDNRSPRSLRKRKNALQSFLDHVGKIRVCDLRKHHLDAWLARMAEPRTDGRMKKVVRWGPTTRRIAIEAVQAMLNWAVGRGIVTKNPVARFERPGVVRRGLHCVVTEEQHRLLLGRAGRRKHKGFALLLTALYETGARPGEVRCVEASHYNPKVGARGAWVIDADPAQQEGNNKLAYRGKRRVIYLTGNLKAAVEELNARYPSGAIFRNEWDEPFTEDTLSNRFFRTRELINDDFARQGKPKPIPEEVTLYGYRHQFVTEWLTQGKPAAHLAALLGTSVTMIEKHYSHLTENSAAISRELLAFKRGDAG
jgi:integrase